MYTEKDFLDFLIRAKKATYAAQGDDASVTPLIPGSLQLEYREDEFLYRDVYFGMSYFIGQETVYFQDNPIWSMPYSGGVDQKYGMDVVKQVYAFLRKAMRNVSPDHPYRGPKEFIEEDYVYSDRHEGWLGQFVGKETITSCHKTVYTLNYSGGFIR